jgi:hypothetical protein
MPATGVIATRAIEAELSTDADVVAYFASGDYRYREAAEDIARCLRAGKDLVYTSLVPMCYPAAADKETVDLIPRRDIDRKVFGHRALRSSVGLRRAGNHGGHAIQARGHGRRRRARPPGTHHSHGGRLGPGLATASLAARCYRVVVDGLPTYTVDIEKHGRGNYMRGLTYATVMRELNAIPAVMAAPPGLLSKLDLPLVTGPVRSGTWRGVLPSTMPT